jgi:hypothetical protein
VGGVGAPTVALQSAIIDNAVQRQQQKERPRVGSGAHRKMSLTPTDGALKTLLRHPLPEFCLFFSSIIVLVLLRKLISTIISSF